MSEHHTRTSSILQKKILFSGKNVQMVLIYFKMPNAVIMREWFPLYTNVWEVQQKLAANINGIAGNLILKFKGTDLDPWLPLAGLEYEDKLILVFDVEVLDDHDGKLSKQWPDRVTRIVKVLSKYNKWIELNVDIETERVKKPWLGGFRHKVTMVEYHHATTQTETVRERRHRMGLPPPRTEEEYTQTRLFYSSDAECQTRHDHGTQMALPGLYTATYNDRIVDPRNYKEFIQKVHPEIPIMCLNKFKHMCLLYLRSSKQQKLAMKRQKMMNEKMRLLKDHSQKAEWDFTISTIYATDRYGIENLYYLVNNWYEKEREKLVPTQPCYRALLINIFQKKLSYLRQIDVLKTKQRDESLKKQKIKCFDEAAKPIIRYYPKGNITVIETCDIMRSKILKELYSCYIRRDYEPEERIEMLLQLKCNVETTIPIDMALPLLELLNREIDMLSMGMKHLEGLRKRITEMLFYFFTSDEVLGKSTSESDETTSCTTMKCISCNELKPMKAFLKRNCNRRCRSCLWLSDRNIGAPPLGPYKFMLDEMRKRFKTQKHSILHIMTPQEIFRLVTKVWHGKSALSGNRDPYKLWLARWDVLKEWKPWNCILLTKDEGQIHEEVKSPEEFYVPHFVIEVKRKNLAAKIEFKKLHANYLKWKKNTDKDFNEKMRDRKNEYFRSSDPFFFPAEAFVKERMDTDVFKTYDRTSII